MSLGIFDVVKLRYFDWDTEREVNGVGVITGSRFSSIGGKEWEEFHTVFYSRPDRLGCHSKEFPKAKLTKIGNVMSLAKRKAKA